MKNSVTREELCHDKLAIADVVYHETLGFLSHQPFITKDYDKGDYLRMSTIKGSIITLPKKDKLWSTTIEECKNYWEELPELPE